MLDKLDIKDWLKFNAQLQQKKNALRIELDAMGLLGKGKTNKFDNYKYFSEAQYKQLFNGLFSRNQLEIKCDEVLHNHFQGTSKQEFGVDTTLEYTLFDIETGFYETSKMSGIGIDKGDKGIYKGYTGAVKYYLANTFWVATGDDPEKNTGNNNDNVKPTNKAEQKKPEVIKKDLLDYNNALDIQLKKMGVDVTEDIVADYILTTAKLNHKPATNVEYQKVIQVKDSIIKKKAEQLEKETLA